MLHPARRTSHPSILEYWQRVPLFLDTETTGLDGSAEIVEICIVDHDARVLLDTLVKPCRVIPWGVTQIHGITNEMVAGSPSWAQVWPQVRELLSGRPVGIYNSDFDLRMLSQSNRASGISWNTRAADFFCIMKLYAQFRGCRWQKLEAAGRQCGLSLPNAHRARADTLLARQVFIYMAGGSGRTSSAGGGL
jgi:DNA polymerase III subunit epsilon